MFKVLFLSVLSVLSNPLYANTDVADKHLKAALEVVDLPKEEQLEAFIGGLVQNQLKTNPSLSLVQDALMQFYREIFTSEHLEYRIARIHMEYFTYEELLEIKEMMEKPIFIRYKEVMPQLMTKTMEVGIVTAQENQARLIELIELEKAKKESEIIDSAGYKK